MNTGSPAGTSPLEVANLTNVGSEGKNINKSNKKERSVKKENTIKILEEELNELKTYSPKYRVNIQTQNNNEHAQLTFETRSKKMVEPQVVLKLDEAIKLIPNCSGEDDIYQSISACDLAINSIDRANVPILIRYITTRVSGETLEVIKYKDLSKWVYIKKYLEEAFESQYLASALQLHLTVKMNQGESINSYIERVKTLFYKLCNIYTSNKNEGEAKIIQNQLKEQTLALCTKGFIKPIKVMVKARNSKSLEEA